MILVRGLLGCELFVGDVEYDAAVQEPVEDCGGDGGVVKDGSPRADASVGGQDHGSFEVALGDDLEEGVGVVGWHLEDVVECESFGEAQLEGNQCTVRWRSSSAGQPGDRVTLEATVFYDIVYEINVPGIDVGVDTFELVFERPNFPGCGVASDRNCKLRGLPYLDDSRAGRQVRCSACGAELAGHSWVHVN